MERVKFQPSPNGKNNNDDDYDDDDDDDDDDDVVSRLASQMPIFVRCSRLGNMPS